MRLRSPLLAALLACAATTAQARDIGAVSTAFKLIGPNHKIVITAFEDPKVKGITCYIARPKKGGVTGALKLAEDPSIGSVSCVQTGPVTYSAPIDADSNGEEVFDESRSFLFKTLSINRLYDAQNGSLIYVVRTTRVMEGSPNTSVSVVTPVTWEGAAPEKAKTK